MTPKFRVAIGAFISVLTLDLATKIAIDSHLSYADKISVIPGFFYLTHVRNTGAAFGLFSDAPQLYRLIFFISVSLIAVGIIVAFYVIDFLHFRIWRGYSWPDFNVADSAIVVGVGFLVLELLASEGEQRESAGDAESNR